MERKTRNHDHEDTGQRVPPPDAKQMNERRAGWAADVIRNYCRGTGREIKDAACDFLVHVMDQCDLTGSSFDAQLSRARYQFKAGINHDGKTWREIENGICALLVELMHWCNPAGDGFDAQLSRARHRFKAKTDPDENECL